MKKIFIFLFTYLICSSLNAQKASYYFPESNLMTFGVYYYPEHWNSTQWERDIKQIADIGFEFVHLAEFAWADMEPEEGKFAFSWLDQVISLCEKYKLKVVLCTPSITPPVWLGIKYSEIYTMNASYIRQEHGARAMNSLSNEVYRKYCVRIVSEMAQHFGENSNIIGWQIDNEPEAKADFSPSAQTAFRNWLKNKYQNIGALNFSWGTQFWSQTYSDFEQILIPNAQLVGWWGVNPHAMLDFNRFLSDLQCDFLNLQSDVLRKYIAKNQFVTTNYTASGMQVDQRKASKLDFASYTAYPNYGSQNIGELGFRMGNPQVLSFANDFFRSWRGTGVMEIQPGQVNWGDYNPQLLPGAVRMWLYHCFSEGASFACSYRFRQINYSAEQYHAGIMKTDGVSLSQGGKDYQQTIAEFRKLKSYFNPKAKMPEKLLKRKTAILWNYDNIWSMQRQRQSLQWDTRSHILKYHQILKSFGAPVDVLYETDSLSAYKFVIAPAYEMLDSALVEKWRQYVSRGGNLILSVRTGVKDRQGHLWQGKWAAPITSLINSDIEFFDQLLSNGKGEIQYNNKSYAWKNWADILTPATENESLANYKNQFYAGKTAVVQHKLGKGSVTYIGVDTDDAALERAVLYDIYKSAGVEVENYPEGVYVHWRSGFWTAVNYTSVNQTINIPKEAKILLGEAVLKPAEIVVWVE